jgi:hypothetical protein
VVKTKVALTNPDGTQVIATLTWPTNHGMLACQFVSGILGGEAIASMLRESTSALDCKRVAVIACDLAEAMYSEMEERDWIIQLPDPTEYKHGEACIESGCSNGTTKA